MDVKKLKDIIALHRLWLEDSSTGARANLQGADLQGANLQGANLREANLRGASLCDTDMSGALIAYRGTCVRVSFTLVEDRTPSAGA